MANEKEIEVQITKLLKNSHNRNGGRTERSLQKRIKIVEIQTDDSN